MKARLSDSPLIKEILKNSKKFSKAAGETPVGKQAKEIGQGLKDRLDAAREFWETSQNPIVYTVSGVIENITGETEEGIATAEIRKLDPKFVKEEWAEEVRTTLTPTVIKAHIEGNTKALKPWLKEGVFNKLAAEIRARKGDGIVFDPNVLDIDEIEVLVRYLEEEGPVIVAIYRVQQIHCVRNRKAEIIEGSESDVRAKIYSLAFQNAYNEEEGYMQWKVVDYSFGGDTPYY